MSIMDFCLLYKIYLFKAVKSHRKPSHRTVGWHLRGGVFLVVRVTPPFFGGTSVSKKERKMKNKDSAQIYLGVDTVF